MSVKLSTYLRQHWKAVLNIITLFGLIFLVYLTRDQLKETLDNLTRVNAFALFLLLPIEWVNYYAQAKLYQGLFAIVGNKLKYNDLFKISLELNFVNSIFPSAGASGVGYFGVRFRREGISVGKASLVQIMKLMLVLISFEGLLVIGLIMLAFSGGVNNFTILVSATLTTLLVIATFLAMYIVGSSKRVETTVQLAGRVVHRLARIVHISNASFDTERLRHWGDELHANYQVIRGHYHELMGPTLFALLANATEVAAVYVVYLAFGQWVNPGAIILAYAVANFAGLISVLPGGIGVYEAIMLGVLTAGGIPAAISFPVIIMYRVLNTIIQLPPGYYFYHQTLHGVGDSEPHEQPAT